MVACHTCALTNLNHPDLSPSQEPVVSDQLIDKWRSEAQAVRRPLAQLSVPIYVLFGEAVDLVGFVERYWKPKADGAGRLLWPGLSQVNTKRSQRISPTIGRELDELQQAASRADTLYLLAAGGPAADLMARATEVLADIRSTLQFLLDHGQEDARAQQLARVREANTQLTSHDRMALALEHYADLANAFREELDELDNFDVRVLDVARELAVQLRLRSAPKASEQDVKQAKRLRNQLWTLLQDRMRRVRAIARYVYRRYPEIARQATSAYERRRRAESRRRARTRAQPPALTPTAGEGARGGAPTRA